MNGIALGQVLSLLVTSTSSISTELALHDASIPFTQGAINYALLFIVFAGPVRLVQWRWKQAAWKYMLVSGIDVLSTGCIVKAFSLTSITSVTLLDNWTIPCVILLTAVVFRQTCGDSSPSIHLLPSVPLSKHSNRRTDTAYDKLLQLHLLSQDWLCCCCLMTKILMQLLAGPPH